MASGRISADRRIRRHRVMRPPTRWTGLPADSSFSRVRPRYVWNGPDGSTPGSHASRVSRTHSSRCAVGRTRAWRMQVPSGVPGSQSDLSRQYPAGASTAAALAGDRSGSRSLPSLAPRPPMARLQVGILARRPHRVKNLSVSTISSPPRLTFSPNSWTLAESLDTDTSTASC